MKRSAIDHPKLYILIDELGLYEMGLFFDPMPVAIGIMESLWHYAYRFTPDGGIGKFPDTAIAKAVGWPPQDAKRLIQALLAAGLVDENENCRLYIHDWHDHCEDSVHKSLARAKEFFANGTMPNVARLGRDERKEIEEFYSKNQFQKPAVNQAKTDVRPECAQSAPKVQSCAPCLSLSLSLSHSLEEEKEKVKKEKEPEAKKPPSPSASELSPEPPKRAKPQEKPRIDSFQIYEAYPRHVGKDRALAKITASVAILAKEKGVGLQEAEEIMLQIVQDYAKSPDVQAMIAKGEEQFIPYPATWFHRKRWNDDRAAWGYGKKDQKPQATNRGQPVQYACERDKQRIDLTEGWDQELCLKRMALYHAISEEIFAAARAIGIKKDPVEMSFSEAEKDWDRKYAELVQMRDFFLNGGGNAKNDSGAVQASQMQQAQTRQ